MTLTKLEKVGMVLAFIPGVSIVTGIIKAYVYRKRSKEHDRIAKEALNVNATSIHEIAQATLKSRSYEALSRYEFNIYDLAFVETIPLINLFGAGGNIVNYVDLSKSRNFINSNENLEIGDFLIQRYDLEEDVDEEKKAILVEALEWVCVQLDRGPDEIKKLMREGEFLPSIQAEIKDLAKNIHIAILNDQDNKSAELIYNEELQKFIQSMKDEAKVLRDGMDADLSLRGFSQDQGSYKTKRLIKQLRDKIFILEAAGKQPVKILTKKSPEPVQPIKQLISLKKPTEELLNRYFINIDTIKELFSNDGSLSAFESACKLITERIDNPQIARNHGRIMNRVIAKNRDTALRNIVRDCENECLKNTDCDGIEVFRNALQSQINRMNNQLTACDKFKKLAPKHRLEKNVLTLRPEELTAYRQLKEEFETVLNELDANSI